MARRIPALVSLLALLAALPALAQDAAPEPQGEGPIDPRARAELSRMIDFMKGLETYEMDVRMEWESIQDSGLKLQFGTVQKIIVARPDRLFVSSARDDGRSRRTWFAGGVLTALDVDENVYTRSEVPKTLAGMLDWAEARGVQPSPLLDFLYPDIEASFMPGVEAGLYVGESVVDGVPCHHLAFRTAEIDFQLWVRSHGDPLPLRYSITSQTIPGLPWFTARFRRWELAPALDHFAPTLPEGARQIEMLPLQPAQGEEEETEADS